MNRKHPAPIMKKLRVIQIGICHEHANAKIETIRSLKDDFEVVGFVDDRNSTAPRWPLRRPESYWEGIPTMSLDEALALPDLDAAFVEVTNAELVSVAERVLARGLPMHMDKPGGESYAPFDRLRKGAKARGLPFQMGYMFRINPAMRWIAAAVREGWLGDIFEIAADMDHGYGDDDYRRYLGTFKGGILYNLGCHFIDFIVEIMGEPDAAHAFILTAPGSPADSRDNGMGVLEWKSGAMAAIRACGRKVSGNARRRLRVTGTQGAVELCPVERFDGKPLILDVELARPCGGLPAGRQTLDFGPQGANGLARYAEQLRQFARQVRGEEAEPADLCDHDLAVQRTLLRLFNLPPPPPPPHPPPTPPQQNTHPPPPPPPAT